MKNEDVALIHQILSGDENAFVSLVNKYQKQVHALAWRKIGDFHIAEEITQDTFLKVYQKLSTLKNPNQFSGWLYVIATNQCRAWLRKKRIETESLDDTETEFIDDTAYSKYVAEEQERVNIETQREVVKKLLAKLKESERTVITLHYLGEMTIEEISRFLGVSASAIKLRLHRARQRLQKEEPMIREALRNYQLSPNLTDSIIQEVKHIKPTSPSGTKPIIPWVIGASSIALIVLMLGMGSQYLSHFQHPYSLDAQSEMAVELMNVPIVQNLETEPDNRNQIAADSDESEKRDGSGEGSNTDLDNDGDYTQWDLPENAKARLGKGSINGISVSPDNTQIAVASATGIWLYDAHTGEELTLFNDHITPTAKVTFSPDGTLLATGSGNRIIIWDRGTGTLIRSFKREKAVIYTLKITDDNRTLICEGYGSIELWNISTGEKKEFRAKSSEGFNARLGHILGQRVTALDLHMNKNTNESILAVGNEKGEIRLEDASTGRLIKKLRGRTGRDDYVFQLAFSPDGKLLVSNTHEKPLHLWDVTSGKLIKTLTQDPRLTSILEFSNDGKTLACQTSSEKVELWDVATQTQRAVLDEIKALAFSPDSKTVAGANREGEIKVWDPNTGDEMSSFNTIHIQSLGQLAYSSDTNTLVSGHGKTIRIWDTFNYTQLSTRLNTDIHPAALVFSPKDKTVTSAARFTYFKMKKGLGAAGENLSSKLSVWNTHTSDKLSELPVESRRGKGPEPGRRFDTYSSGSNGVVAFSKNGYMLAAVLNEDRATEHYRFTIHLWAIPFEKSHAILKGHTARIYAIVLTPDGKTLASGSADETIRIWDTSTGNQLLSLPSEKTRTLAISVDGKILASSNTENIKLWDISTGTQLKTLKVEDESVTKLAISPDGKMLASGNHDGKIRLWDITTGNQLNVFKGHFDNVNALSFSSDGKTLASGSYDGAIFLWNLTSTTNTNQDKQ